MGAPPFALSASVRPEPFETFDAVEVRIAGVDVGVQTQRDGSQHQIRNRQVSPELGLFSPQGSGVTPIVPVSRYVASQT